MDPDLATLSVSEAPHNTPVPFLRLPQEVRSMIYGFMPGINVDRTEDGFDGVYGDFERDVDTTVDHKIFLTNRQVYLESKEVTMKNNFWISIHPPNLFSVIDGSSDEVRMRAIRTQHMAAPFSESTFSLPLQFRLDMRFVNGLLIQQSVDQSEMDLRSGTISETATFEDGIIIAYSKVQYELMIAYLPRFPCWANVQFTAISCNAQPLPSCIRKPLESILGLDHAMCVDPYNTSNIAALGLKTMRHVNTIEDGVTQIRNFMPYAMSAARSHQFVLAAHLFNMILILIDGWPRLIEVLPLDSNDAQVHEFADIVATCRLNYAYCLYHQMDRPGIRRYTLSAAAIDHLEKADSWIGAPLQLRRNIHIMLALFCFEACTCGLDQGRWTDRHNGVTYFTSPPKDYRPLRHVVYHHIISLVDSDATGYANPAEIFRADINRLAETQLTTVMPFSSPAAYATVIHNEKQEVVFVGMPSIRRFWGLSQQEKLSLLALLQSRPETPTFFSSHAPGLPLKLSETEEPL